MSRKERWPFEASVNGLLTQAQLMQSRYDFATYCEYRFHAVRRWRFDIALQSHGHDPLVRIGLEYHGGLFLPRKGGHQTVRGARNDWEKLNEAQILGWTVLQFGPDETRSGEAMNVIARAIEERLKVKAA